MNFGVREVATSSSKSTAPGWVYVTVGPVAASQPSSRKRARNEPIASQHETTAKQDAKILRELVALDRENHRDVSIPVPVRHRDNAGRVSHGKVTPAVRKILLSQKTFTNYLSDFEALSALPGASQPFPLPTTPAVRSASGISTPKLTSADKRSHRKKDAIIAPTPLRKVSSASQVSTPQPIKSESGNDIPMLDAPAVSLNTAPDPPPHKEDINPLLISRIPAMPMQEEIDRLLAAPPLSYNEARGSWTEEDIRKPVRRFCEVCGYWGRVKCTRCGGRVCALECLSVHQEECFTRYGA